MAFNENTRVKIPAIIHLCRLGYKYISLSNANIHSATNIFTDIFFESLSKLNKSISKPESNRLIEDLSLLLDYEDLGKAFYDRLIDTASIKLIDFDKIDNNQFHVVTELTYKNGEDEFRPDITLLINGMPLAFIEVKKPNNQEGILAERSRINVRFQNKKFRKFINITQLLVFSNNMEYDNEAVVPLQGAFYSSTSYQKAMFNYFREEEKFNLSEVLADESDEVENIILTDNNLASIKHTDEFKTNKNPESPTHRILTSLFSKKRLFVWLRYCLAYVKEINGLEKHVMRYQQFFATKALENKLESGIKKGIIWHTQGSGKTAFAYYNVKYLTDYFNKKGIVPKFYFIVDRLDLMIQAKNEFTNRGLIVHTVSSKDELAKDFKQKNAIHNSTGKSEITVVNIQKFKDETNLLNNADYDIKIQRIYFLDEVHRSYNPNGSFLANLYNSDRQAILIGLTGTPLIADGRQSKEIFGDYIHKYYYNSSIADGYTLKLIREGIENSYKIKLEQALKEVEVLKGDIEKRQIYSHPRFVEPMIDYIVEDFFKSRIRFGDKTIGGMVVCDSADQAKTMFDIFIRKYGGANDKEKYFFSGALILHDVGSKDERKDEINDFKAGKIDFLFVYNMLLTGFDAKRLKKLYIGRLIKDHNLLQTLTRVNRPYKEFRFGYVVDFADIRKEFDETNKAYFDELQAELGDEIKTYSNLFLSKVDIEAQIKQIKEQLFAYDLLNAEVFAQQINQIEDRKKILEIKKALENARNLYNVIRLQGHFDLLDKLDFRKLSLLYAETSRHLDLLNVKDSLQNSTDTTNLLNVALENIIFMFRKVSESEMVLSDNLKDMLRKTREALGGNYDPVDPQFITLYDELKRIFEKKNLDEVTQDEMKENIGLLKKIYEKVTELNRKNSLLKAKYAQDEKYARIHKRVLTNQAVPVKEMELNETLNEIKHQADERIMLNAQLLNNESYFSQLMSNIVVKTFEKAKISLDYDTAKFINDCVVKEYLGEFHGSVA